MTALCFWDRPGTKVNASYYRETLLQRCLHIRQKSDEHFVFPQDGAPAVSSSEVNCRVPAAYRAEFHRITVCMATQQPGLKSGRLCCLGSFAAERVLHSNFQPVGDLKDRVRTCWESLDQQIINKPIDKWRDRLKAVVWVNGGHIEQLFWIRYLLNLPSCSAVYRKFMRSKNVCAFCHCVSSVTVVLWQKVNLTKLTTWYFKIKLVSFCVKIIDV